MFYNIFFYVMEPMYFFSISFFRYFVVDSNEKLEIYGTIEAGMIYPILFIHFMTRFDYWNITQPYPYVKQNTYKHIKWGNI